MDRRVDIKVNGTHLSKDGNRGGVRGEANVTYLRISFDDGWKGFAKKVTFWDAKGKNPVTIPLTADMLEDIASSTCTYLCPIPGEALTEGGMLTFIIDGYTDGKRQRSVSDELEVVPAPLTEGSGEAQDPTPSEAERLQKQIDGILDTIAREVTGASEHAKNAAASEGNAADYARKAKGSADSALASENAAEGHAAAARAWAEAANLNRDFAGTTVAILDTLKTHGNYTWLAQEENPFGAVIGALFIIAVDVSNYGSNTVVAQTATQVYGWAGPTTGTSFKRVFFGEVWSEWRTEHDSANGVILPNGTDLRTLGEKNGWYMLQAEFTYTNNAPGASGNWCILDVKNKSATLQVLNGHRFICSNIVTDPVEWDFVYTSRNLTQLRDALKAIW